MFRQIHLISTLALTVFSIETASANIVCQNGVLISSLFVGWGIDQNVDCPDLGNCISFEYRKLGGSRTRGFIVFSTNLDDGPSGYSMFEMLKSAMIRNVPVNIQATNSYYCSPTIRAHSIEIIKE
ncbi:TPA: hypothetical protein ACVO0S_001537 [Vibrio alginolyticus]